MGSEQPDGVEDGPGQGRGGWTGYLKVAPTPNYSVTLKLVPSCGDHARVPVLAETPIAHQGPSGKGMSPCEVTKEKITSYKGTKPAVAELC